MTKTEQCGEPWSVAGKVDLAMPPAIASILLELSSLRIYETSNEFYKVVRAAFYLSEIF
jgi:hypothetical protein